MGPRTWLLSKQGFDHGYRDRIWIVIGTMLIGSTRSWTCTPMTPSSTTRTNLACVDQESPRDKACAGPKVRGDLVERDFNPERPNERWVSEITEHR